MMKEKEIVWDIGINTDELMDGATGRVGNFVFRTLNGVTVVSRRPKKPTCESVGQRDNRDRFRMATAFAKRELLNPEKRKHYARLLKRRPWLRNAYTVAIKTFMNNAETVVRTARAHQEKQARRAKFVKRKTIFKPARYNNRPATKSDVVQTMKNTSVRYWDVGFHSSSNRIENLSRVNDNRCSVQTLGP